jgi:hypothetical protein
MNPFKENPFPSNQHAMALLKWEGWCTSQHTPVTHSSTSGMNRLWSVLMARLHGAREPVLYPKNNMDCGDLEPGGRLGVIVAVL